jgi:hypothetical protein
MTFEQFKELFCWVSNSKESLSLFTLNQHIQLATGEYFDRESTIHNYCSSLFNLIKTGSTLFGEGYGKLNLTEKFLNTNSGDFIGLDEISAEEVSELGEVLGMRIENEKTQLYFQGVYMHLRHGSLEDYLRNKKLESTKLFIEEKEARYAVTLFRNVMQRR